MPSYLVERYIPGRDRADDVREANELAAVPYARIVAADEIGIAPQGRLRRGDP